MPKLPLSLTNVLNAVIKKLYNFDAWETAEIHEKPVKECFDIQARGPQMRMALGICPVWSMVNPALGRIEKNFIKWVAEKKFEKPWSMVWNAFLTNHKKQHKFLDHLQVSERKPKKGMYSLATLPKLVYMCTNLPINLLVQGFPTFLWSCTPSWFRQMSMDL